MKTIISAIMLLGILGTAVNAKINLTQCAGCHGKNFEKSALGKSRIVKDLNATEIETALKGYKSGTYGGTMKGIMKGMASKYNNEQIKEISEQISQDKNTTSTTSTKTTK